MKHFIQEMIQIATLEQLVQAQTDFLGELDTNIDAVISNLNALMNRQYGYTHTEIVTNGLEADYQAIITADNALTTPTGLENASAVGLLVVVKNGETIPAQGCRMFINGTEEQTDYSFSGTNSQSGIEIVKVWYFESGGALTLERPAADILAVSMKTASVTPSLSSDFFDYAGEVTANTNLPVKPLGVRKHVFTSATEPNLNVADLAFEIVSSCETLTNNKTAFWRRASLKKVSLPCLKNLLLNDFNDYSVFDGCTGLTDLSFPVLEKIGSKSQAGRAVFNQVARVVIPATLTEMGSYACYQNKIISLNCKNATSINDSWCDSAPSESFTMCSDWGATINIATAAANWTMADFIGLMTVKLRDMTLTSETRTLKIPSAMLTAMQADTDGTAAITAATNKGWTITS